MLLSADILTREEGQNFPRKGKEGDRELLMNSNAYTIIRWDS